MTNPHPEIPKEWLDELEELRERVAEFPEDEEDRVLLEGISDDVKEKLRRAVFNGELRTVIDAAVEGAPDLEA